MSLCCSPLNVKLRVTVLLNLSVRRTSRKLTMNCQRNTIPISTPTRIQNLSRGFTRSQRHMTSWVTPGSDANRTKVPLLGRIVNAMTTSWSSTNTRAKSSCRNGVKPRIGTLGKALTAQSGPVNNASDHVYFSEHSVGSMVILYVILAFER